ncbi:MAG TPA: SpoIIE family protein phosphatase [Bacteroidia bacterium]|jgi:serine phosphatase RsbU (regulator of sigma subunit)|nr:SpoIIE family protein phosphatase [Bacteroidia bacterium]
MAFKFTIGRKIGAGFGIVLLFVVLAFIYTNVTIAESKKKTDQVVQVVTPSVAALETFQLKLQRSQILITKWFHVQSPDDDPFKKELRELIKFRYAESKSQVDSLSANWTNEEKESIKTIFSLTDKLFAHYHDEIMTQLNKFTVYDDAGTIMTVRLAFEEVDDQLKVIYEQLNALIDSQKKNAKDVTGAMFTSFNLLMQVVKWLGIILVIGGLLTALFTVRTIVKPVKTLKNILQDMSYGVLPKDRIEYRGDEIGDMNVALNGLIEALERTTEFARQVGSGNFESYYRPLSEQDNLGHALLKMRTDLAENERVLEQKVIERTEEVVMQKKEIEQKNHELEIIYKHVTDSIRYAKRLQQAILPPDAVVKKYFEKSFVLFKPKDIVSGDFYWVDQHDGKSYVAAVDCTGHGVPGAFMSIVGYNLLKEILNNPDNKDMPPSVIMDKMSKGVVKTLHAKSGGEDSSQQTKDGMDMSMCIVDYEKMQMQYSGAFNPLYLVRNGTITQYKADKFPIGLRADEEIKNFTNNVIQLQKDDTFYIFSDGYADQFGGPKGKKYMTGNFRELLLKTSKEPISKQRDILDKTVEGWRGELEQVDDILVIGIQI